MMYLTGEIVQEKMRGAALDSMRPNFLNILMDNTYCSLGVIF